MKARIGKFIEDVLLLKVNSAKSRICQGYELNFLGHSILPNGQVGLSEQSEQRIQQKVKQITKRRRGVSLTHILLELSSYLPGWLMYFKYALMSRKLTRLDGWIRRKLRCYRLKQCKRVIGIVRRLRNLGVEESLCWRTALTGKGWWRISNSPGVSIGMSNQWLELQGYYSLLDHYQALHRKLL